jgi:hypothetical protein
VTGVELMRTLRRAKASPAVTTRAQDVLGTMAMLRLDALVLAQAAAVKDPRLRSLDALLLASALSLGDVPEAFVTTITSAA